MKMSPAAAKIVDSKVAQFLVAEQTNQHFLDLTFLPSERLSPPLIRECDDLHERACLMFEELDLFVIGYGRNAKLVTRYEAFSGEIQA